MEPGPPAPAEALGAKEAPHGESYEVRSVRKRILPSLTPRKDCYKGSKVGGGLWGDKGERNCKAAFRILVKPKITETQEIGRAHV